MSSIPFASRYSRLAQPLALLVILALSILGLRQWGASWFPLWPLVAGLLSVVCGSCIGNASGATQKEEVEEKGFAATPPIVAYMLLSALIVFLFVQAVTLFFKFDVTDEATYIYALGHPRQLILFFVESIFGWAGSIFFNNIIVWRFFAFVLLTGAAAFFAASVHRLCIGGDPRAAESGPRFVTVAAAGAGVLLFYSYGPPTFSYRAGGSASMLFLYGALVQALLSPTASSRRIWSGAAGLAAALFASARPPVLAFYPLAALPLLWLAWRREGTKAAAQLVFLHGLAVAVVGALLIFGVIGAPMIRTLVSGAVTVDESHSPMILLKDHWRDISETLIAAAGRTAVLALGTGVASAALAFVFKRSRISLFQAILAQVAAVLPTGVLWGYFEVFSLLRSGFVLPDCLASMFVCQGPTPALSGADIVQTAWTQLMCLAVVWTSGALSRCEQSRRAAAPRAESPLLAAIILSLAAFTLAGSAFTNTGIVYHCLLTMTPLLVAVALAFGLTPLPAFAAPRLLAPVSTALYALAAFALAMHNSAIYPYRVQGGLLGQTVRLDAPPTLAGLRVDPALAGSIAKTNAALKEAGFDASVDMIIAPYNLAGLVVAANARALGHPWMANDDELNCHRIASDNVDLDRFRRLFIVANQPVSPQLAQCLRLRGADLAQAKLLAAFPAGLERALTISVVNLPSAPSKAP